MEIINAVGRRKAAVARVYLKKGTGAGTEILVNGSPLDQYFPIKDIAKKVMDPIIASQADQQSLEINAQVNGGGFKGQAEALRMAIARALCKVDVNLRGTLKEKKYLTRDAREVERKKFGKRKARKSTQFSKR